MQGCLAASEHFLHWTPEGGGGKDNWLKLKNSFRSPESGTGANSISVSGSQQTAARCLGMVLLRKDLAEVTQGKISGERTQVQQHWVCFSHLHLELLTNPTGSDGGLLLLSVFCWAFVPQPPCPSVQFSSGEGENHISTTNWIQGHRGFRVLCHESTKFGAASALHRERNVRTLREGRRELKEIDTLPYVGRGQRMFNMCLVSQFNKKYMRFSKITRELFTILLKLCFYFLIKPFHYAFKAQGELLNVSHNSNN